MENFSGQRAVHAISAMPMLIIYRPALAVVQPDVVDGETIFVESAKGSGEHGWSFRHTAPQADAFDIRRQFLEVADERSALNFLRDTGVFSHYDDCPLRLKTFRAWQRATRVVMGLGRGSQEFEAEKRRFSAYLASESYSDNFFGIEQPDVQDEYFIRRMSGASVLADAFFRPSNASVEGLRRGGEISECADVGQWIQPKSVIRSLEVVNDYRPALVFRPRCTIEAIASAVWIERHSGVRWTLCPGCKSLIKQGTRERVYCETGTCKARIKKQKTRKNSKAGARSAG